MNKPKLLSYGSRVLIKDSGLKANVISCCLSSHDYTVVEYRIVYWSSGDRHDTWVFSWEIEPFIDTKKKAGMVNYETDSSKLIG